MKQSIEVRDAISRMSPYKPPLENRDPEAFLLMDFNESPLPPPPGVIQKISEFLNSHVHIYPIYGDFLEKLENYSSVPAENLLLTNGSDQAIDIIMRTCWKTEKKQQWCSLDFRCTTRLRVRLDVN